MSTYHQLKSLKIEGYKSIKDNEIVLGNINVLIGQNGAGKTNFISLFKFLRNLIEGRLKQTSLKTGAESILYYGSKQTKEINIYLDFSPNLYKVKLEPTANDSLVVSSEYCGFLGTGYSSPYWDPIALSEEESKLSEKSKKNKIARYVYDVLKDWRVYHFHDTSENAGVKKYCSLADNKFLFEDASNLAAFLYVLKHTQGKYYERIVKTTQLVIPFFKDFVLEPSQLTDDKIRLEWNDKYSDKTFTASELSDGSLRFICMATLLLQRELPKVILLDEPELGLHPSAITILCGLLKKASKRSQVIVSTQSVSIVNEFDAEEIIVVEREGGDTVFHRLESQKLEHWLNDYSLGELWDKNIIGGKP
jgi:predicted ATPase